MEPSESKENLVFDYHTIRGLIGLIAISFPLVVILRAGRITDSISWSYHTDARDLFVGLLFVIGAFLISYKGRKPELHENDVSRFWKWMSRFWKGAINFRIWERKHEEDLVSLIGGIAAWTTAVCPTTRCIGTDCPDDPISSIHYIGAVVLFSTTVYFCLFAFRVRAIAKSGNAPKIRSTTYVICGWGIAAIMLGLIFLKSTQFGAISNLTFWAETAALELFGFAWLIASQYLPWFTEKTEQQKLF